MIKSEKLHDAIHLGSTSILLTFAMTFRVTQILTFPTIIEKLLLERFNKIQVWVVD